MTAQPSTPAWLESVYGALAYNARLYYLLMDCLYYLTIAPFRKRKVFRREATFSMMVEVGIRTIPILMLINFLVGLILAMQSAYQLQKFGVAELVSGLVAVTICREIGPLITAIVLSARVGASITAQLGTMVVSEEIMALQTMALRPVPFLVNPRLLALAFMTPCLTVLANFIGMFGGYCVGVFDLGMAHSQYINGTLATLTLTDFYTGLVKSVAFGVVIALVSCLEGLRVEGGAEGVGLSTTRSVVISILLIIITDLVFTILFYL